jgi:eukaryotic-like serine/threonine-protein kinase
MKADRWAQIDHLLDEALERAPQERATFLAAACQGDDELRCEVESLLAAHAQAADGFLQAPALEVAAKKIADDRQRSLTGRTLGPYSVISVLGVGGMGEVYLARDTRLGRKIALKLLPKQFTTDAARVRRFEIEARAASALNHPNILTIYEIGTIGAEHFIAAEYVDGLTIRAQLSSGKLAVKDAVAIALQVASALEAAHEAGIVHRDIKPENVMRRRDDYVKVVDFGLAKLTERRPSLGQTHGSEADLGQTNPGTVLGTISYMSPEQALGHEVDRRTDIFSLGVMLYEMLAGVVPFKGATNAALLDAIVHHQPLALTAVRSDAPLELERIINRALEKDRELRYQTAGDLRADLKRLQRELESAPAISVKRHNNQAAPVVANRLRLPLWAIAVISAVVVLGGALWWFNTRSSRDAAAPWLGAYATQLTDFPGEERDLSLSPDGKNLYYSRLVNGKRVIYWQRVDGSNAQPLTDETEDGNSQPACSPDGNRLVFRSERQGGGLFVMGATGESVRQLSEIGFNPAWSPDGKEIVCGTASIAVPAARSSDSELYIINVETGARRKLVTPGDAARPHWSPSGRRIAYLGRGSAGQVDIWTIPVAGGAPTPVTSDKQADWNPIWSADGRYIYFVSERQGGMGLWRIPIDEVSGRPLGELEAVLGTTTQVWQFDLSRDQRRLVYLSRYTRGNLQAIEFDPQRLAVIGQPVWITRGSRPAGSPDVSPDGALIVHHTIGGVQEDLFVVKSDGSGQPVNLTNDQARDRTPRWSPDGRRIAFYSNFDGPAQVWVVNADGSGRRKLTNVSRGVAYPFWSPDGRRLGYNIISSQLYLIDLDKSWEAQTPVAVPLVKATGDEATQEWFIGWDWSRDNERIAGWRGGRRGGEVRDLPGIIIYSLAAQSHEQITDIGTRAVWLNDHRHVLFTHAGQIYLADTRAKNAARPLWAAPQDFITSATITRDNRRLYYTLSANEADIHLLTLNK